MAGEDEAATGAPGPELNLAVEYGKCSADAAYFIDTFASIDDAQGHGDGSGTMPFRLWPAQVDVLWQLMVSPLTIILKARQLGISWICCGYALWLCMFSPGKVVLIFSMGQLEADEMLRRVKVLYQRLPPWLRDSCPLAKDPNTSEMVWSNGSRVKSLPASQNAGSGFTASLVIMDEAAKIQFASQLYTALKPTIDGGGQLIILSTANGIGNLFHQLWMKAAAGTVKFRAIFLPWSARPGRTRAWRDAQTAEESEPGKALQEYPGSASESFLVSGRVRFKSEWVAAQDKNVEPSHSAPGSLRSLDGVKVYRNPEPGRKYIVAADVAEGLEGGDYSSSAVIDSESWEEMADDHGQWEPDEFAKRLVTLATHYDAWVVVERNNHGHAVLASLKALGYRKIANGHDGRPGWLTNPQTKPQAVDALAEALRDRLLKIRTQATLDELLIYRIMPNGNTSAPSGFHDDRVMKWVVGLGWIRIAGSNPPPSVAGEGKPVALPPKDPYGIRSPRPYDEKNRTGERPRGMYGRS